MSSKILATTIDGAQVYKRCQGCGKVMLTEWNVDVVMCGKCPLSSLCLFV